MSHAHHPHDSDSERVSFGRLLFRVLLAVIIVGLLAGYSMLLQVPEGYTAVVTRFGELRPGVYQPGLSWKWPWPIEQAHQIDMRRRLFNTPYTATFTHDQRNVILLTYVVWEVEKPKLYLQSVRANRKEAEGNLDGLVTDRKNYHLGRYDLSALVSTHADDIKTDEIEQAILADVAPEALAEYGIKVEQVGIKRVAYPEEVTKSVLEHMRAERRSEAGRIRAEGDQKAAEVHNAAFVESANKINEGKKQAGSIRAATEKQVAEIWEKAVQWDLDFYRFWRSLQTLEKTLGEKTTIVLRTDQGIMNVLMAAPELTKAKVAATTWKARWRSLARFLAAPELTKAKAAATAKPQQAASPERAEEPSVSLTRAKEAP
jgi:membrane protease subunit HflC